MRKQKPKKEEIEIFREKIRESGKNLIKKWQEIEILVQTLDIDILKAANGISAANDRSRPGIKLLRKWATEFFPLLLNHQKLVKREKQPIKYERKNQFTKQLYKKPKKDEGAK